MLRVVFFGAGGILTELPLQAVAASHQIVGLVQPRRKRTGVRQWLGHLATALGLHRENPVSRFVRSRGIPVVRAESKNDPAIFDFLRTVRPDLICVAAFPWLLPSEVLTLPRLGAINLHSSLLPRHRGPLPLFWIYFCDDRQSGVTVHQMDAGADTGDILLQKAFDLPRGFPVEELNAKNARHGAALLRQAADTIEAGAACPVPQDHARATSAPRIRRGEARVNFAEWDVERVWHFLAGLYPRFREPLHDARGRPVVYGQVLGYVRSEGSDSPGTVRRAGYGWSLACRGGVVKLARGRSGKPWGK